MIKQPVLAELQYFVNSVSLLYKGVPPKDTGALVKSSLHLLEDLPSTRDAVFEYFTLVFNNAVKHYMNNVEKNIHDPSADDEAVQESLVPALERLVACGPPAWSPMISSWCLKLLGELCKKHGRRRPPDIRSACNLWLGCTTIRYLVSLTALCLEKLTDAEMDGCIAELLTIYESHSPSFDWVVARLGGCFPLKAISCMVAAGLKRFDGDYDQVSDSEVEILSYLGLAHDNDLRYALKSSLEAESMALLTVPYLLLLAKSSDTISQALVAVFLDLYNEKRLDSVKIAPKQWPPSFNLSFVLHMVAGLLLKIRKNSTSVTLLLAKLAAKHGWCQELLEVLFVDLETLVLDKQTAPLLEDIFHEGSREALWKSSISDAPYQQQVAVRLILLASFKSNSIFHQSIVYLLSVNDGETASLTDKPHLNSLARLLGGPHGTSEVPKIRPAFETAIEKILLAPNARTVGWNILHNMVELLKLERTAPAGSMLKKSNCGGTLFELLDKVLQVWEKFMILERQEPRTAEEQGSRTHEHGKTDGAKRIKLEPEVEPMEIDDPMEVGALMNGADASSGTVSVSDLIHESVRLVECLDIARPTAIGTAEALKLSQLLVKYFFFCLQLSNADAGASGHCAETSEELLQRVYLLLSRHCGNRKAARTAALRELLEGALFMHGELFGSQSEAEPYSFDKSGGLLIKLNQKQGIALNASRATVLHAGIIGQGPKVPSQDAAGPAMAMQNRLLNAIVACCQDVNDHQATIDGFSYVSLLLVELISPDVMYNGLPWPEEEFTKVTMERDLQIRRTFRHSPVLWSILGLIACYRPSLCYCSVLLRALCASALHQWRSKSAETLNGQKTDLMHVTTKLLELMALAQLLPPPLSYLHIVLEYFDGPEIAYVLKECVWNYMKDHVPSPVLFVCDPTGFHWRDPLTSRPPLQYTNPLRNTMQKKLTKVGHLYYQMFVGPELRNPSPTVNPPSQQGGSAATNAPSSTNGSEQGVHKTAGPHLGPGLALSPGPVQLPGAIMLVD